MEQIYSQSTGALSIMQISSQKECQGKHEMPISSPFSYNGNKQQKMDSKSLPKLKRSAFNINRSLPTISLPFETSIVSSSPVDICTEALNELSEDWLKTLDAESSPEDIFADNPFEPIPINEVKMTVSNGKEDNSSRLDSLRETLKDVLDIEGSVFGTLETSPVPPAPPSAALKFSAKKRVPPKSSSKDTKKRPAKKARMPGPEALLVDARRFRDYQACQWTFRYHELLDFKEQRGHCCVPHGFEENPVLARWVKRQRYQYKLKLDGKASTMTDDRVKILEEVGFVWDSHGASWMERLNDLQDYAAVNKDCNVPSNHEDTKLSSWVKCQRRQYKLFKEGKQSNMTADRIIALENIGFEWEIRKSICLRSMQSKVADLSE